VVANRRVLGHPCACNRIFAQVLQLGAPKMMALVFIISDGTVWLRASRCAVLPLASRGTGCEKVSMGSYYDYVDFSLTWRYDYLFFSALIPRIPVHLSSRSIYTRSFRSPDLHFRSLSSLDYTSTKLGTIAQAGP